MASLTYQPHQSRQNVRLGWEAGRRQETSTYPGYLKLKETCPPKPRVLSNPLPPNPNSLKTWFRHRHRRKTINTIHASPPGSIEMRELKTVGIGDVDELQASKILPEELPLVSFESMPHGLRPPEVTSSKPVPLNLNESEPPARDNKLRPVLTPPDAPAVIIEAPPYSSTEIMPQQHTQVRDSNFYPRPTNDSVFWEEWSDIAHRRTSILSLRSRTHEMRRILREKQNLMSNRADRLMQRVLQQELAFRSTPRTKAKFSPPESILDLVQECQIARDDYGPFEDQCTSLEDQLYRDEFVLHRLEEQFYSRWNVVPNFRGEYFEGHKEPHQIKHEASPIPSIDFQAERLDYEEVKYHPMVDKYLSRKGDLEILNEQLYEFEERLDGLEEDRESRDRYGRTLDAEDEQFRANAHEAREKLLLRIHQTREDVEELRDVSFSMKLVDEYGEPTSTDSEEWKIIETDEHIVGSTPDVPEYSKFSILIPQPKMMYTEVNEDLKDGSSNAIKSSEVVTPTSSNQVEFWMLMIVRCSAIDVNHLARWSEWEGVTITDIWQQAVLDFWFKDGYSEKVPINRSRTASLTTQAPRQPKKLDPYPGFGNELAIMRKKESRSPRYFRPPPAGSLVVTEIEDVMGT